MAEKEQIFTPPKDKLRLPAYIFKYPKLFWKHATGGIILNTVVVFSAIFLGRTIDAADMVYKAEAELSLLYSNLFLFLASILIIQIAQYNKRYNMRLLINQIRNDIRAGLLESLLNSSMLDLSGEKVGDMMSRMIGDVDQVGAAIRRTVSEIWDTAILMLSYFVVCMIYSPKITLIVSIPIPVVIFLAQIMRHPLYKLTLKARKAAANINIHLQHKISGISLLRLYGLEDADNTKFSGLLDIQLKRNVAATAYQSGLVPLYVLIGTCGVVLVVGMGGENVINGTWTIGMFTAYLTMFLTMVTRSSEAGRMMNTWHGAKASWDRICEKLVRSENNSIKEDKIPVINDTPSTDDTLEIRSLNFTYPFSEEPCLKNISFTAKKGEIIGITGPVGSGKSALATALSGLFPYDGDIIIEGVPLYALSDKRSEKIAYMDAEHFVFSDDVKFNVTLDRDNGDIYEALSLSAIKEDIKGFENGLDTRLMERGMRISGGQRQRITLARAWYSNSKILILDDPFSAIDINMEQEIMTNLIKNKENHVILLFSHRLASFTMVDNIIVLDKGQVSQMGTHDELIKQSGLYHDIYTTQEFFTHEDNKRGTV